MSEDRPALVLEDLATRLAAASVDWYLFGAQAAAIYGGRRVTVDVDVSVRLNAATGIEELITVVLSGPFESRVPELLELAQSVGVCPLVHTATSMALDVVIANSGLEQEFFERAQTVDIGGTWIPIISREDLIISKLIAGRPHDEDDVRQVLRASTALDTTHIQSVLADVEEALAVSDLIPTFERLRKEAKPQG